MKTLSLFWSCYFNKYVIYSSSFSLTVDLIIWKRGWNFSVNVASYRKSYWYLKFKSSTFLCILIDRDESKFWSLFYKSWTFAFFSSIVSYLGRAFWALPKEESDDFSSSKSSLLIDSLLCKKSEKHFSQYLVEWASEVESSFFSKITGRAGCFSHNSVKVLLTVSLVWID